MCKTLKFGLLAFAVLGIAFLGCDRLGNPIDQVPDDPGQVTTSDYPYTTPIMAGQTIPVGQVTVYFTSDNIYVKYTTTGDWYLTEYHVAVTDDCEHGFDPYLKNGNPAPGSFPYKDEFPRTQEVIVEIPWGDLWGADELCFAAHCVVERVVGGQVKQRETGWGRGNPFPGGNWAMYFCTPLPKILRIPTEKVTVKYIQVSGSTPSMFRLSNVPVGYSITSGDYRSFCLDRTVYITGIEYQARLWSSYDPTMPDYCLYNRGTFDVTPYDKINYLVDYFMDTYTGSGHPTAAEIAAFQQVFWYYRGLADAPTTGLAKALLDLAELEGDGWYPQGGDWLAILMDIDCTVQLCFIIVDP